MPRTTTSYSGAISSMADTEIDTENTKEREAVNLKGRMWDMYCAERIVRGCKDDGVSK